MRKILLIPIKLYRLFISPMLPSACRFTPTCSEYAMEAIELHGFGGVIMAIKRIGRCHPWGKSGFDPVKNKE